MSGIFLLAAMLLVAGVAYWLWRNDKAPSIRDQIGPFRMAEGRALRKRPAKPAPAGRRPAGAHAPHKEA